MSFCLYLNLLIYTFFQIFPKRPADLMPKTKVLKRSKPLERDSTSTSISTFVDTYCLGLAVGLFVNWWWWSLSPQNGGKPKKILEVLGIGEPNDADSPLCYHDFQWETIRFLGLICRSICFFQWIYVMAQDYDDGVSTINFPVRVGDRNSPPLPSVDANKTCFARV